MTQAADNYVEAHGNEINRSETKQNKWSKYNTVSADKAGQNVVRANTVTCEYCNIAIELRTVEKDRLFIDQ